MTGSVPVRYKKVLWEARKFELDRHEVILCTCSCAASASLKTLDVRQILVDEAGMATEPETLIPLVRFPQAEKVGGAGCVGSTGRRPWHSLAPEAPCVCRRGRCVGLGSFWV